MQAQELSVTDSTTAFIPGKYLASVNKTADKLSTSLDKKTDKLLRKLQQQENRIYKKLQKTDSVKAKQFLEQNQAQYKKLEQGLQKLSKKGNAYIPSLDTLTSSLKFLQQNPELLKLKDNAGQLTGALDKMQGLQQQFNKAELVKKFLKEKKQTLSTQLQSLGLFKELKQLNKQVYYYQAQVNEYKEILKDHKKIERKAIELLSQTKLFKDFMSKNSQLASLFRLPGNTTDPAALNASLAGLQTRAQVNNLLQQQLSAPGAMDQFRSNMQDAQSQLNSLRNRIGNQVGNTGGSDIDMPQGFKPNTQKTKSFKDRIEYNTDFQSQKSNGYFPTTSDIGLSAGYKLNDKSVIGIGASYKIGWGQNIQHIKITHQGIGLRSFIDWKIKGGFWLTGGYEQNYRNQFNSVAALKDLNAWQQSGLIGVSKQISLKSKIFKKTSVKLLWDFLSYQQVPRTQPVLFRVGYGL
jgi:predicted  nucleic acid-binding Zn-ribbon protein